MLAIVAGRGWLSLLAAIVDYCQLSNLAIVTDCRHLFLSIIVGHRWLLLLDFIVCFRFWSHSDVMLWTRLSSSRQAICRSCCWT